MDSDDEKLDELPMLKSELKGQYSPDEFLPDGSLMHLRMVNVRPDSNFEGNHLAEQGDSDVRHGHLWKSGPLGKCDDPYCTTCPTNDGYSQFGALPNRRPVRSAVFGRARNVKEKVYGWSRFLAPGVLNPHTKLIQRWNKFFVISCLIAIFLDPLFFFLLSVDQTVYCIVFNVTFSTVITILRSITDFIYFLHMLLQFRLAYVAPASGSGELIDDPKKIASHYLKGWFLIDLIAVLPLPQVMIWLIVEDHIGKDSSANATKNLLRVTLLFQYVPRIIRFLPLLAGHSPNGFIFETAWANFVINILMYLLGGHVVGSCWYLFGLQRVNQCLQDACHNATEVGCVQQFLDCGRGRQINETMSRINSSKWESWTQNQNASNCFSSSPYVFTYGIYLTAVPITGDIYTVVDKYIYSLFWGFQQISSLAGNQMPSLFIWEVLFTMGIVGLGLLLLTLLIGNMQNFLQSLGRRDLEMQLRRYDVEKWMGRRHLPLDIQKRVRQAVRFQWAATRGVDEKEILEGLPEDLLKFIRRHLFLELVKKVRLFTVMDDQLLDVFIERLHQKLYIEGSEVLRVNQPVHRMLFIVHGNLRSDGADGSFVRLEGGDFCGEELLTWCLERHAVETSDKRLRLRAGQRAVSTRTVKCLGSVEAFSLEFADLEDVVRRFSRSLRNTRVQGAIRYESPSWRTWAAGTIQVYWRYLRNRQRRFSISRRG
ncbi:hypothetical protein O6H91_19G012800 [Diphasiastrum complanatum]|uniref:Uncharacterized protein n=1 Tax=Diphasiastrum complanatum TaxID=34168 RepID=A0ACC2ASX0_DIPCM|nr:hypothetical protein O6H91_19G012800 [Diphasiastrum complanatum]